MKKTYLVTAMIYLNACSFSNIDKKSSDAKFIENQGTVGLINYVKQEKITICLSGAPNGSDWQAKVQKAVLAWIEPLRPLSKKPLTTNVDVVSGSRQNCDGYVRIQNGGAYTSLGDNPTVTVGSSGYYAKFNVLLHEFGHAFGLLDTYYNGQSGTCQQGQPQSVMCNTSFDTPQADDIRGITKQYASAFSGQEDSAQENTAVVSNSSKQTPIHVLLTDKDPISNQPMETMFASAPTEIMQLSLCQGDEKTCRDQGGVKNYLQYVGSQANLKIFRIAAEFSKLAGNAFSIVAFDASGNIAALKTYKITRANSPQQENIALETGRF